MNPYRMKLSRLVILGLASLAASFWVHIENLYKIAQRRHALKRARVYSASVGRPVLNYGCEETDYGDVNADIVERSVGNFVMIEPSPAHLPFPSKLFGAVVCNHVIEHVPDPEVLRRDLERVADRVFVVMPNPLFLWTWLWPDHKWIFIGEKTIRLGLIPRTPKNTRFSKMKRQILKKTPSGQS